jgi:hypothetical protein
MGHPAGAFSANMARATAISLVALPVAGLVAQVLNIEQSVDIREFSSYWRSWLEASAHTQDDVC